MKTDALPVLPPIEMDALPLEYKLKYGTARGDLNVSDIVNNPVIPGVCSVLSLSFTKETLYPAGGDLRAVADDFTNAPLIT